MNEKEDAKGIRTVQRSIDILNCFTIETNELSLTEIAKKIDLAKSTTTRLLATLEQNDFVQKDPNSLKYKLGKKMYFLGHIAEISIDIKELAKPIMEQLRNESRETVSLYIIDNQERVCVQRYTGLQSVQHIVNIGEKLPLWAGSSGKAILAFQSPSYIELILRHVKSKEARTKLENEIPLIRKDQCAVGIDERTAGVAGVAAPIFNIHGQVSASICISGPSMRFTPEIIDQFRLKVKSAALELSGNMGYRQ